MDEKQKEIFVNDQDKKKCYNESINNKFKYGNYVYKNFTKLFNTQKIL